MKYVIQGGILYDGSCKAGTKADLLIENGKIAAIDTNIENVEAQVINAAGLAVTPGFIDVHRHCDVAPMRDSDFGVLELTQGLTSTIVGNCGLAPVPLKPAMQQECSNYLEPVIGPLPTSLIYEKYTDYFNALEASNPAINMGVLAGAGAIKTALKGYTSVSYTQAELKQAAAYVEDAMQQGAYGVSLGIMYLPECYSTTDELAQVVAPAAKANGILTTHIRGEGDSLVSSVEEVIEIARRTGIRLQISHFKATGIHNWNNKIHKAIASIEKARAEGLAVTADFYPYTGGSTTLLSLIPPTALNGGGAATLQLLATPEGKALLRTEIYKTHSGWDNMALSIGWERILISSTTLPQHASYSGHDIATLAAKEGYSDASDFICDLLVAEGGRVGIVVLSMSQDDVDTVAKLPYTTLISDGLYGGGANPHPRLYGSFPRFIHEYVNKRKVVTLEQAIYKMSGMPAEVFGIEKRGFLKAGYHADICIFNPATLTDKAEYANSRQLSTGMEWVFINGQPVLTGGKMLATHPAKVLRHK